MFAIRKRKNLFGGCDQRIRRTTTDGDGGSDSVFLGDKKKMQTRKATDENHDDENKDQDPFEMFGPTTIEDVDYNNSNNRLQEDMQQQQQQQKRQQRDPANGFNSFHRGTEQALIQYVRNKLESIAIDDCTKTKTVDYAIRFVDEFCLERHWMMHIGVSCVCCVVFYVCVCVHLLCCE